MAFRYPPQGTRLQGWREPSLVHPDARLAQEADGASEQGRIPRPTGPTGCAPWPDADKAMRPLWAVLALAAMTVACLGLGCLAYAYHAATHPSAIHHAWGDPWTGPLP